METSSRGSSCGEPSMAGLAEAKDPETARHYRLVHREEIRAYKAAYRRSHREVIRAYKAAYKAARREEKRAYDAYRRAVRDWERIA